MPHVQPRWKDKKGKLLPEEGQESERDMRVDVVHYTPLEEVALEACTIEKDPDLTVGFSIAGQRAALVSRNLYAFANTFSLAFEMARCGMAMQREPWEADGLLVRLQVPDEHSKMTEPYLYMLDAQGRHCPWAPSNVDLVAQDWKAV